jgi:glutamine synthetase type III
MATQTQAQPKNGKTDDLFDLQGALERWTEASRKAGNEYLDLYEKAVNQLADLEVKTANSVKIPAVVTLAETHAAATREVTGASINAARDLLKAQ